MLIQDSSPSKSIVLIGAGHTNLHVVRQWCIRPMPAATLTLISAFNRATYSGMLSGTLAGLYRPDDMQIDLENLTAGAGIRLIVAEVTGLRTDLRLITFADRDPVPFDIASVGIGSVPSHHELWQQSPRILSIKPMTSFLARLQAAIARYRKPNSPFRCVIVGSGAAGTEVAFCLDAWFKKQGSSPTPQVTIIDGNPQILNGYVPTFVQRARSLLAKRGIQLRLGRRAASLDDRGPGLASLQLADGSSIPADVVIWATNASPPAVLQDFDLPHTEDGFLAVRATLQTTADAPVFVVGDTASFVTQRVPKAGVYAVREGPILRENLQRMLTGRPLVEYHPQRSFLSLLSTGDGRALLQYKRLTAHGRWVWWLKDYIDRQFVRQYQVERPG